MFLALLTLLTALAISGVVAYFSVVGLAIIFSGAFYSVIIMGSVLEVGKLVTASWLYNYWKTSPLLLKSYLFIATIILMMITSMGVFGYLSRAHIEQTADIGQAQVQLERIESQLKLEDDKVKRYQTALDQLDKSIDAFIKNERATQGLQARQRQAAERAELNQGIKEANAKIDELMAQRLPLQQQVKKVELEVGPLKYVAEFVYGEEAKQKLETAVRWVILMLVVVFDPLAVLLLVAANHSLDTHRKKKL